MHIPNEEMVRLTKTAGKEIEEKKTAKKKTTKVEPTETQPEESKVIDHLVSRLTQKIEDLEKKLSEVEEKKPTKSLTTKLSEIYEAVQYVQMTGHNAFQKYKYPTERDVTEKIRLELAKRKIFVYPSLKGYSTRQLETKKEGTLTVYTVDMEYTFRDGETGEEMTINFTGEGQDKMEKAIYKAYTGAQKYAIMKAFMLPTGEEPEQDNSDIEVSNIREGHRHKRNTSGGKTGQILSLVKTIAKNQTQREQLKDFLIGKVGEFEDYIDLTPQQEKRALEILQDVKRQKGL